MAGRRRRSRDDNSSRGRVAKPRSFSSVWSNLVFFFQPLFLSPFYVSFSSASPGRTIHPCSMHACMYACIVSPPSRLPSAAPLPPPPAPPPLLSPPRYPFLVGWSWGTGRRLVGFCFIIFFFYFLSSPFLNLGLSFPSPTYHESQMINKRVKRKKLQTFGYLSFPITRRIQSRRFPTRENRTKTRSFLFILIVNNNYRQQRNTTKNVNPQGCSCPPRRACRDPHGEDRDLRIGR